MKVEKIIVKDDLKISKGISEDVFYKFLVNNAKNATVDIDLNFEKEGTSVQIFGVVLCYKNQKSDIKIKICHNIQNCKSDVKIFTLLDGKNAKLNYDCNVTVKKIAKNTKTNQYNENYLLSKGALVTAKPKLITETLSEAGHKSVIIDLRKEPLFYFQAHGISKESVKQLLTSSYTKEFL